RREVALAGEIIGELLALPARFPLALARALVPLQRYASEQLALSDENPALIRSLAVSADSGGLPPPAVAALDHWRTLAQWLLRADAAVFLKTVNTNKGFPAKGNGDGAADRSAENWAARALLNELEAVPGLAAVDDGGGRRTDPTY